MVEGAALEMLFRGNFNEGSNPSLSVFIIGSRLVSISLVLFLFRDRASSQTQTAAELNESLSGGLVNHLLSSYCPEAKSLFVQPALVARFPAGQLVFFEPQCNLLLCSLNGVRTVNQVATNRDAKVASNSARG